MLVDSLTIRAKYSETDQMGFVHHSNYARYYENARWELFRKFLLPYDQIEKDGLLMPVVKMNARFIKPIRYDDEVSIVTRIAKLPKATLDFDIEILNKEGELVHRANVSLAFLLVKTQAACRPPKIVLEQLQKFF